MPEYDLLQFATDEDSRNVIERVPVVMPEDQWPPPEDLWLVLHGDGNTLGVFVEEELPRVADALVTDWEEWVDDVIITPFRRASYSSLSERADHVLRAALYLPLD